MPSPPQYKRSASAFGKTVVENSPNNSNSRTGPENISVIDGGNQDQNQGKDFSAISKTVYNKSSERTDIPFVHRNSEALQKAWPAQKQSSPGQTPLFSLTPLSRSGMEIREGISEFFEESIEIKRDTVEPDNPTIDSRHHAVIYKEGEDWFIDNRSASGDTYIRVGRKMKLEPGDVIILGNRKFKF